MKRFCIPALICLMLLSFIQAASGEDTYPLDRSKIINDISGSFTELTSKHSNSTKALFGTTDCVDVDLELPDSFTVEHTFAAVFAEGYFELINCGDEAADISLTFSIDINLSGIFDTLLVFPEMPVTLGAGETIAEDFKFVVPPFEGSYTVCVTAASGDIVDSVCQTMTVAFGGGSPGMPIAVCGVLLQGDNCVLFSPVGQGYDAFVLSDYGGFAANDTVFVAGNADLYCQTDCVGAIGCIEVDSLTSCGGWDPAVPFHACGVLVDDTGCVFLYPFNQPGQRLSVENMGDFMIGDTVFVDGILVPDCDFLCYGGDGCVIDNSIHPCPTDTTHSFEATGIIYQGTECVVFIPFNHDGQFLLDNLGDAQVWDTVYVAGELDVDCVTICGDVDGCIHDNIIEVINIPGDPNLPFNGIGVLVENGDCVLFANSATGELLDLSYLGEFGVGDTVCVAGMLDIECDSACGDAIGCVDVQQIHDCGGGTPPDTVFYQSRGFIVQGTDCILFQDELTGQKFLLDYYADFHIWDTVCVAGLLDVACESGCPDADGCVDVVDIVSCGTGGQDPPPLPFNGVGLLLPDSQCVYFSDFQSGMRFYLDDLGGYGVYDTVCVIGELDTLCDNTCLIDIAGCIDVMDITDCGGGTPPDTTYYQDVGVLLQGTECVLFSGLRDSLFLILENYDGFVPGDTVCVEGIRDMTCENICMEASGCLFDNSIADCGTDTVTTFVSLTGTLVESGGCLLFSSPLWMGPGAGVTLDNYADFTIGDDVTVTGYYGPPIDSLCFTAVGHISDNTIGQAMGDSVAVKDLNAHNYPNPFNPVTTISFDLPVTTVVTVTVHNIIGQTVAVLIDGETRRGEQSITWNGTDSDNTRVSSGIYFYRIKTSETSVTKKMIMMK